MLFQGARPQPRLANDAAERARGWRPGGGCLHFGPSSDIVSSVLVRDQQQATPSANSAQLNRSSAMPLTKRQREILNYLTSYTEQNGYAPSFEEIAEQFRYSSLATVHEHLSNLERKGYIKRSYNESRAIEILPTEATPHALELPVLGSVAAGLPIESIEH